MKSMPRNFLGHIGLLPKQMSEIYLLIAQES